MRGGMKGKVFITGVDGFVGAHLARKLLDEGHEVVGLIHDYKPVTTLTLLGLANRVTLIRGDICDGQLIRRILTEYYIQDVYHLAAQAIVAVALKEPVTTYKVNCLGTVTVLDACKDVEVRGVLVASTDKVYGEGLDKVETDKLEAKGIYETSKICLDYIARNFYHVYPIPVVISRACNIYGEYDLNKRIIPNTVLALKNNQAPLIFKNDKSQREYIYVEDVCSAYIMLMENINKSKGEAFNVGTGDVVEQEELVKKIIQISGENIEPLYVDKPKGLLEIYRQSINCEKIRKQFNWRPRFTLSEGIKRTWERWL